MKYLSIAVIMMLFLGLSGCTEITNTLPTESSKFVGTWKSSETAVLFGNSMTLFSDGTGSMAGFGGTWELKDDKLVITMGNNELVSSYDYYFSEDDTKLHLRSSGSDKYSEYEKQLD